MKPKKLARLVEAEIARRQALKPVTFRTLTVDFEDRTIAFDGSRGNKVLTRCVTIPILSTETPVIPRG